MQNGQQCLFDTLSWRDPLSKMPLVPIILARTPGGVPICGALQVQGTTYGYPIVDCVVRLTPELAHKYGRWLEQLSLQPPEVSKQDYEVFQAENTVESFGWQWAWNSKMRSDEDLRMRVIDKFNFSPELFSGKVVLDAGAGAGDQSQYMISLGAGVVSVDLSSAIEVVASKLRMNPHWVGIQGDIMHLPFTNDQFDIVYCEGVIQHTEDSVITVKELCRILKAGGFLLAAHYVRTPVSAIPGKLKRRITTAYYELLRRRFSRSEPFKLLFTTGLIAALNYLPLVGFFLRKTGTVLYYDLMPDFKTTWTNTYDYYGAHAYQRFITPDEFYSYFEMAGGMELIYKKTGNVLAKKISANVTR